MREKGEGPETGPEPTSEEKDEFAALDPGVVGWEDKRGEGALKKNEVRKRKEKKKEKKRIEENRIE